MSEEIVYCSFCNKSPDEVDTVIAGVTANICNDCVALCNEILNSNREICSCGAVDRASADNDLPIEYNRDQKRYYISGVGNNKLSFYHCFACGSTLTDRSAINRSNFQSPDDGFEKIDNRELVEISALIKPAKSIAEMITILGEPDQILLSPVVHNRKDKEIYHYKDVLKSASFSKNFQTVNIIAQEMEDGEFQISYIGKLKAE